MKKRSPLPIGKVLQGRYEIISVLGHGGMGVVYEAKDNRVGAYIALKETYADEELTHAAFVREAKLLANLTHEAFPDVKDFFSEEDGHYLVMELVRGDDLAETLFKKNAPFEVEKILEWADQILDALDDLHSQGIYHRDLKPSNLKVNSRGKIKVLDFGLAKGAVGDMTTVHTVSSLAAHSNFYSPLEQILRSDATQFQLLSFNFPDRALKILDHNSDARGDIYSLGATLYNLLTNTVPVNAPFRAMAEWSGKGDNLPPVRQVNPQVSQEVSDVLHHAIAIERDDRFTSANEMREALRAAVQQIKRVEAATTKPKENIKPKENPKPLLAPKDYVERAVTHLENGEPDKAIALCDIAIEQNGKLTWAYNIRGNSYKHKGNLEQAIKDYNKAIELSPTYSIAFNNRASAYNDKREYDQAIKDYSKAIELNPDYPEAFNNRGNAYYYKGEYDQAIKDYSKAIELNPDYPKAFSNRGNAYNDKREYDQAIKDCSKAIELNPDYPEAFNNRGNAYYYKGEYTQAIKDYTKAIEFKPDNTFAYQNRANAYDKIGETEKAKADRKKAEELEKKS